MKLAKDHVAKQDSDSYLSECEKVLKRKREAIAAAENSEKSSLSRRHRDPSTESYYDSSSDSDSEYDRCRKSSKSKYKRGKKKRGLNNKARTNKVKCRVYWAQEAIYKTK